MLVDEFQGFNTRAEDHFLLSQVTKDKFSNLPPIWFLLNSKSTKDIITHKAMVLNIKKLERPISIHCNTGSRQVEYTSDLNGYGRVWYDPKAVANILSLSCATRKYWVVLDSESGNCFRMLLPGRGVVFNVFTNGLYYHDTVDRAIVLINMVA